MHKKTLYELLYNMGLLDGAQHSLLFDNVWTKMKLIFT